MPKLLTKPRAFGLFALLSPLLIRVRNWSAHEPVPHWTDYLHQAQR
ncbi:hypothetical protein [Thiosulfatihalobacter marinus]|nr:hypothetical protein [Thiosulfatihalobacter marinus]